MPFVEEKDYQQPNSTPHDLGGVLSSVGTIGGDVAKTLLPRITALPGEVMSQEKDLFNQAKEGLAKGKFFNTPQESFNIQKRAFENTAPAAAEAAMFAVPGAGEEEAGSNLLQKLASGAMRYGSMGALYGGTTPGQESIGQRLGGAATGGVTSSILGPLVEGLLGKIGIGAGKAAINPQVEGAGSVFGVPAAKTSAVKEALAQTSAWDTEGMASQMGKKVADTTKKILSALGGVDKQYSFANDLEDQLSNYVKENVKGLPRNFGDLLQPLKDKINEYGQVNPNAVGDFTHNLQGLFSSRQGIDDFIKEIDPGVFTGGKSTLQGRVMAAGRSFLKNFIDKEAESEGIPVSQLTEMESRLYSAGKGIAGKTGSSVGNIRSPQQAILRPLMNNALLPIARVGTSRPVQNESLMKILNSLGIQ